MSNNIEHRIFWDLPAVIQPGRIISDHYEIKSSDEKLTDEEIAIKMLKNWPKTECLSAIKDV